MNPPEDAADRANDNNNYEFTFHTLLDDSARIEVDPDPINDAHLDGVSLTESIYNYHHENGRTYHAYRAGSYYFPNDQIEVERLDNQHEIIKLLMDGRNYLAPWSKEHPPTKVLDVATGTGRWAVEVGDEFPTAEVIGIDLSPIQPTLVPPNVSFFVEDATEDWHEDDLDYVHTRFTTGCWADMAQDVVVKAFARLVPGGWLECQEVQDLVYSDDGSLPDDAPLLAWCRDIVAAGERARRPLTAAPHLRAALEAAGFVDVQEQVYKLPVNAWPRDPRLKRLGALWQRNLQSGLQAFSYGFMHRVLGRTKEAIEVSLVDVRKDVANLQIHAYSKFYVVWGRKPAAGERRRGGSGGGGGDGDGGGGSSSSATTTPTPTIR